MLRINVNSQHHINYDYGNIYSHYQEIDEDFVLFFLSVVVWSGGVIERAIFCCTDFGLLDIISFTCFPFFADADAFLSAQSVGFGVLICAATWIPMLGV